MAAFEARRGKLSLIGDLLYADLSSEKDTPFGRLFDSVETDTKVGAFSGYALYRAVETPQIALDLGGGFRAYSVKYDTTLEPALLDEVSFDLSEEWVDPLLAARAIVTFNERWSANAVLDVGGFDGENDSTWQALASVNYAFNDRWSLRGGWRYLDIQKEIGGLEDRDRAERPDHRRRLPLLAGRRGARISTAAPRKIAASATLKAKGLRMPQQLMLMKSATAP